MLRVISRIGKIMGKIEKIFGDKINDENRWSYYNFWNKVDIKSIDDCWNWKGSINGSGYGLFSYKDEEKMTRTIQAHRMAYILGNGQITGGLQAQHLCNNRICCNPFHLELGDNSKNQQYMMTCGRCNKPKGENQGSPKLKADEVGEILKLRKENPKIHQSEIATRFNISQGMVSCIVNGKWWRHVYDEFQRKDLDVVNEDPVVCQKNKENLIDLIHGHDIRKKRHKYTREGLIEKIQQYVNENGRSPREEDLKNNHRYPSYITFIREFGSLNDAIKEAGFKKCSRKINNERLNRREE